MNFRAFNNYMNAVENAIDSQHNYHDEKAEITFNQNGRWALNTLERIFNDKDFNIRRWLNGKPCVFTNEKSGKKTEVNLGTDREALYYFLTFCKKVRENQEISEIFREYLAFVIARSCVKNWEEC